MLSLESLRAESEPATNEKPKRFPDFTGFDVVCIATGPSLTALQVETVRLARKANRCRVIAINEAGLTQYKPLAAPWADILYAADRAWWYHYRPEFYGYRFSGEPVPELNLNGTIIPAVHTDPLTMVNADEKMPREPGSVVSGGHSGFQALGLALTLGAARVLLLGFDCGGTGRNCHTDRPEQFKRKVDMGAWVRCYNRVPVEWPDVPVINCSPTSAITAFPKQAIEAIL